YAKYYSRTEHLMIPEILVFSKRVWEELSPEDQDLIMRLAKEAQQRQRQLWYAEEEKALADMKAHGVEVVEVADKEALRESVKPVWDKFGGQLGELVERIQAVQEPRSTPRRPLLAGAGRPAVSRRGENAGMQARYVPAMDVLH